MNFKKNISLLVVVAILLSALAFALFRYTGYERNQILFLSISWIAATGLFIILFNTLLNFLLDMSIGWRKHPKLRFILQLLLGTIVSLACLNLSYQLIKTKLTGAAPQLEQLILMNIYGAGIILPILATYFSFKFLNSWNKSQVAAEQLKKENVRSQLANLRNHLDPHFLFNNLNILSSLMDKDIQLSQAYLDKFAEVYRIILKTEVSDLTTIEEELKLIKSYLFLLQIRFSDSLKVDIDIHESDMTKAIPPLSIQMLIENAIKHNELSVEKPIYMTIKSSKNNFITISNNKQLKKYMDRSREGTGLENIMKRYAFFTESKVKISDETKLFSVDLPLIEIEY